LFVEILRLREFGTGEICQVEGTDWMFPVLMGPTA
jgi:hypothetical protein